MPKSCTNNLSHAINLPVCIEHTLDVGPKLALPSIVNSVWQVEVMTSGWHCGTFNLWQKRDKSGMEAFRIRMIIEIDVARPTLSDVSAHGTVLHDCVAEGLRLILTLDGVKDDEKTGDDEGTC